MVAIRPRALPRPRPRRAADDHDLLLRPRAGRAPSTARHGGLDHGVLRRAAGARRTPAGCSPPAARPPATTVTSSYRSVRVARRHRRCCSHESGNCTNSRRGSRRRSRRRSSRRGTWRRVSSPGGWGSANRTLAGSSTHSSRRRRRPVPADGKRSRARRSNPARRSSTSTCPRSCSPGPNGGSGSLLLTLDVAHPDPIAWTEFRIVGVEPRLWWLTGIDGATMDVRSDCVVVRVPRVSGDLEFTPGSY